MNIVQNLDVSLNIPTTYSPRNYNYANSSYVYSWGSNGSINVFNIGTGIASNFTLNVNLSDASYNGISDIKNVVSMDNALLWIEYTSTALCRCIITYYIINGAITPIYKTSSSNITSLCCIDANNFWFCDVSSNFNLNKYNYSTGGLINSYNISSAGITSLISIISNGTIIVINYNVSCMKTFSIPLSSMTGTASTTQGPCVCMDSFNLWCNTTNNTNQVSISTLNSTQVINTSYIGAVLATNGVYVWGKSPSNSNSIVMYNVTTQVYTTLSLINGSITPNAVIVGANATSKYVFLSVTNSTSTTSKIYLYEISFPIYVPPVPCFLHGTKICTNTGYRRIEDLRKGDLIQTTRDGFKKIHLIGKRDIEHKCTSERIKNQLYKCTNEKYPEVFEDLVMTGCHCILIDESQYEINDELKEKIKDVHTYLYVTDSRLRLPTCVDERASVYEHKGVYTIYHLALENEDYYMNYGIYANGLLVETCSKRFLEDFKLSQLNLIE